MIQLSNKSVFIALFFLISLDLVHSRPGSFQEFGKPHEDRCKRGDLMVIEVCQHCAKQTKSNIAYPMCCTNEDDAYNWCGQYINYGKKAKRQVEQQPKTV